jgi:TonB-dependent receptor
MIKFGGKARLREKTLDEREILYDGFPGDPTLEGFAAPIDDYDLDAPFVGPAIDPGAMAAFIAANVDGFDVDEEETFIASAGNDFEISEDVFAAYLMSRVELGNLRLVGGVRWERTELEASGSTILLSDLADEPQVVPFLSDTSYDDFMPSITARWQVRDDMLIRAAASRTISRPEFGDIAPLAEVELEDSGGELELAAAIGNPELDPYQSINLDLAWEWYFGDIGVVSVGAFYKDIEDFVVRANVANFIDLTQFVGNVALDDAEVIQPINGDSASLMGMELAFTRKFSELPAPFDGLLVNANATFTDSEADLALRDGDIPLPFQSDTVANLILGYEKGPISLRLSSTYRDERLAELVEVDDPAFDRYEAEHLQIDFAGTYDFTPQLQLSVEVVNLNDEPFYAWFQDTRFNSQFEQYGRTVTMGLRWQNQ